MTRILTPLVDEDIDGVYYRLYRPFEFYSDILGRTVQIPSGFVYDKESVPLIRGTSNRGGLAHDYLCRKDSKPTVDKATAARVYREVMEFRGHAWWRRWIQWAVVRVAPFYFHKFRVLATYEEITGKPKKG